MRWLRTVVFGATFICLVLNAVDAFAKKKEVYRSQPIPRSQIQIDPNVLEEHRKRFGQSAVGNRYLNKSKANSAPQIVETPVEKSAVDSLLELPVVPQVVGDYRYTPKYRWGKQKTLGELLRTNKSKIGPRKETSSEAQQQESAFKEAYQKVYGSGSKTELQPK
jgi:hypothetical protein